MVSTAVKKLIPPSRFKITIKQQPKGIGMIVEDHDMSDRFSLSVTGLDPTAKILASVPRCGIRQPVV